MTVVQAPLAVGDKGEASGTRLSNPEAPREAGRGLGGEVSLSSPEMLRRCRCLCGQAY
jgi:hypothetical protein